MSIYYSSEADLCLLCSQLCLLTTFCLPEKNEDWGQSEKWGKGRQRRPNLKLQGGIIESLKWNKKCVPKTSLKWGERMRSCTRPGLWAPSGVGWAGGSLLRVSLRRLSKDRSSSPGSAETFVLCRQEACFLPSTVLRLPSLFPGFSGLLPARLETQASEDLPPARELSSPGPPPLALG